MTRWWAGFEYRYWYDEQAPARWWCGMRTLAYAIGAQLVLIPIDDMLAWSVRQWAAHIAIALFAGMARMQPSTT